LVDESTTLRRKTTLVVVLRTFFETFPGEPYTFNLELNELCSTSAEQITIALLECLNTYGFDQQFLKECLVCFACDGASVMIGKNSGVATRCSDPSLTLIFEFDDVDVLYRIGHTE